MFNKYFDKMNSSFPILKSFISRILTSIIVLLLLITFVFVLVRLAPGDPAARFISPKLSPELAEQVKSSFGLNESIHKQYFLFISKIVTGDLGISYNYRMPVLGVIKKYFLFTFILASISLMIQIIASLWLAKIVFRHQGKFIDRLMSRVSIFTYSVPAFVVGLVLVYLFSVKIKIFPTSGLATLYEDELSFLESIFDNIRHLILPLITLSIAGISIFFKYLRDNLIAVSNQAFITNLRALGVNENIIYKKHILPNAIQPLISIAGVEFGLLLGGALITEVIFSLPGMGRLTINAIVNNDYPLVIGCTLISGVMVIAANLFADLIKAKFDKRLIKELLG